MRNKKLLFVFSIFFFIALLGGVWASDQNIDNLYYDFYNDTYEYREIEFSNVKIEVITTEDASCKYDTSSVDYWDMDGSFDLSSGKLHEKSFTDLGDGIYTYFVKCDTTSLNGSEPAEMELVLRVNSLVTAQIVLSEDPPLRAGRTELTLLTSKVVSNTPSLSYSFDNVVYTNLPLMGNEKVWRGYLIIPKNIKEAVVSFKFHANDLEGRRGEQITSGGVFIIDNVKPSTITDIDAIGYLGSIELDWNLEEDEDIVEYRIYRSEGPGVDYNDFHADVDDVEDKTYEDGSVERGETYYYRVAAVDEAGNLAELSKEVYATALREDKIVSSGLALHLVSHIENFVTEINSLSLDVDFILDGIDSRPERIKTLFYDLNLDRDLENVKKELNALKKDAEKFKLQDLSESNLITKIDALEVRLGVIKRKAPESLTVFDEGSKTEDLSEEKIRIAMLELDGDLLEKQIEENVVASVEFIESSGLEIESEYYSLEIVYLDGTTKERSIIKRKILGDVERMKDASFVEIIPKDVVESASEIDFKNGAHEVVKEDPVLSFSTDTKEIVYVLDKKVSVSKLGDTEIVFVKMLEEEEVESSITGYFFQDLGTTEYGGIALGVIVVLALIIYFVVVKRKKLSREAEDVLALLEKVQESLKNQSLEEARKYYQDIREKYSKLIEKEKKNFHKKLTRIHDDILIVDIERGLSELEKTKDKVLFEKIEKKYSELSEGLKKRVSGVFEKIKKNFEK